ncbi:MAG TPA: hypothetical protein VFZ40_18735, partial [Pyrinomonadaceae bacterium]
DTNGRFGIPNTDMGIMRQEAEVHQRPEYYGTLFNPDGVQRERARMKRGAGVIASNPVWFASVMVRRAASMTRLERTRLISNTPTVTNPIEAASLSPVLGPMTSQLLESCQTQSSEQKAVVELANPQALILTGDNQKYGRQFLCGPLTVKPKTDYLIELSTRIDQGRMRVSIEDGNGRMYTSDILEPLEVKQPTGQPAQTIRLPFASMAESVQVDFSNEASNAPPIVHVDAMNLYELGPASFLWTHLPRMVLRAVQRAFVTAVFLPLALVGVSLTIFRKRISVLVVLSVVPLYYFTVQSAFHTEYRYVLAVNYFLFAFAAVAISWAGEFLYKKVNSFSLLGKQ